MKREELKTILGEHATDEVVRAIMELNGADVEREKGKIAAVIAEKEELKKALTSLQEEAEGLKAAKATDAEYKAKFEALTAKVQEDQRKAAEAAAAKEKAERVSARFKAAADGKEWTHDAIRDAYLARFSAALDDAANEGKSDADIFHLLTKDDAGAFKTVQGVRLPASKPDRGGDKPLTKAEILAIKDTTARQKAIAEALAFDPNYFDTKG